ncbi:MAG: acyl-CoA thioesterase [Bacteroidales bacterium]
MEFYHTTPVQLRFNDIDMLGHTTNSVYQQYFDLGRMEYIKDVLEEEMNWQSEGLILVNISISFMSPVKLYDDIEVRTKVIKLGNKSLNMSQQVYNLSTNRVAAESKAVMVGFNGTKEESILLPKRWRSKILAFEKNVETNKP